MQLLKSELRKFATTRSWVYLLLATVFFALVPAVLTIVLAGQAQPGLPGQAGSIVDPPLQAAALTGVSSSTIFIAVLGILGVCTEYRYRTIVPTFLVTPARYRIMVAKLICYLLMGLAFAAIAAVFVVTCVWIAVTTKGGTFSLTGANGAVLFGGALAAGLYGVIGVGVGALIVNQLGAILSLLGYTFVVEGLLAGFPATQAIYAYLPGGASRALVTPEVARGDYQAFLLSPWLGALIIVGYGVVFTGLALVLTTRRDVN